MQLAVSTRVILISILLSISPVGSAAEQWTGIGTLKTVYPLANGDFVLIFDVDSPLCPATGPGKYMYGMVGVNGMTAEGAKKIYTAALTALITRAIFRVAFDDSSINCYVNRATLDAQ